MTVKLHGTEQELPGRIKSLFTELIAVARFAPASSYQRFAYACGAILVLSGVLHGAVYLVDGGPWEGPVSWRKPIVFGLSFGVTVLTLSWFLTFLRIRKATGWVVVSVLVMASAGEVFLISMQTWRGVGSHFNESTAFDARVFSVMGMLVALVALVSIFVTVRSFFPLDAPQSLAWAIRTGLVIMLVSQAVGVQMIVEGSNTFGDAGALKVPHAVTLHAVQVLPALALLLLLGNFSERRRTRVVCLGAAGYALLIAATMLQTYAGRGLVDPSLSSSVAALLGLGLLAACGAITITGIVSRWRQTTTSAPASEKSPL